MNDSALMDWWTFAQTEGKKSKKVEECVNRFASFSPRHIQHLMQVFLTYMSLETKSFFGHVGQGFGHLRKFGFDAAVKEFQDALKLDPKSCPAILGLACTAILRNDVTQAHINFSRVVDLDASMTFAVRGEAFVLLLQRDYDGAMEIFEQLEAGLNVSGGGSEDGGTPFDDADADGSGYASVRTSDNVLVAMSHACVAAAHLLSGHTEEVIHESEQALEAHGTCCDAVRGLAHALLDQGKYEEALQKYTAARDLYRSDCSAWVGIADCHTALSAFDAAEEALKKAVGLDAANADVHRAMGDMLLAKGERDEAGAAYMEALRLDNHHAHVYRGLGWLCYARTHLRKACKQFHTALRLENRDSHSLVGVGNILLRQNELGEAAAAFRAALHCNRFSWAAHAGLASVYTQQHDLDAALGEYQEALTICGGKNAELHTCVGDVCLRLGQPSESVTAYRAALAVEPSHAAALSGLNVALLRMSQSANSEGQKDESVTAETVSEVTDDDLYDGTAIHYYREVISSDASNADAHRGLGDALLAQCLILEATSEFQEACRLDPNNSSAHRGLGDGWLRQNKLPLAVQSYHRAFELDPNNVPAIAGLAEAHIAYNQLSKAQQHIQGGLKSHPTSNSLHRVLGDVHLRASRFTQAAEEFGLCLAAHDKDVGAHRGIAEVLLANGDFEGAVRSCRTALRVHSINCAARGVLAKALLGQNELDAATAEISAALKLDKYSSRLYNVLGHILLRQNKLSEAHANFMEALRCNLYDAEAHIGLGDVHLREGRAQQALDEYKSAADLNPQSEPYRAFGQAYLALKKFGKARSNFESGIAKNPNCGALYLGLGDTYWAEHISGKGGASHPDTAVAYYMDALRFNPHLADAHTGLGRVYQSQGISAAAEREFSDAIALDAFSPLPHVCLGDLRISEARPQDAIAHYRAALNVDPACERAVGGLTRAFVSANGGVELAEDV